VWLIELMIISSIYIFYNMVFRKNFVVTSEVRYGLELYGELNSICMEMLIIL
jgi:hypothetical protein